jgi:hypothetical protein
MGREPRPAIGGQVRQALDEVELGNAVIDPARRLQARPFREQQDRLVLSQLG